MPPSNKDAGRPRESHRLWIGPAVWRRRATVSGYGPPSGDGEPPSLDMDHRLETASRRLWIWAIVRRRRAAVSGYEPPSGDGEPPSLDRGHRLETASHRLWI